MLSGQVAMSARRPHSHVRLFVDQGLEPGAHRYKFIVDGMWVVDMALPAECDSEGNTNNVVHVLDCSAASLSPAAAFSQVRLEAARLALNTKLGVGDRRL